MKEYSFILGVLRLFRQSKLAELSLRDKKAAIPLERNDFNMIAMRPINEPDVLGVLNDNRFDGDIEGYVVMDGPAYLGHALYKVENDITLVLDVALESNPLIDGAVRAAVAAGERAGAHSFAVNTQNLRLAEWAAVFCKNDTSPYPNEKLFHECK